MSGSNFINRVTRRLKRRYGQPVTFRKDTSSTDFDSGEQTIATSTRDVPLAIVIQQGVRPELEEDLTYIATNRPYTYNALFDITLVRVIVERVDLLGFDLRTGDKFQWNGHVHTIEKLDDFEANRSVIVSARTATAEPVGRVFAVTAGNHIRLEQEATLS